MIFKALKISTKTILYTLVGILLFVVLLVLLVRTSYFQTRLAQHFAPQLSKALGYPIEIDKVKIHFFDEATFEGVRVKDYQGFQMINIAQLDIDFDLNHLVFDTLQNQLDEARLYRPNVQLVIDKQGNLNIDEFIRRINKLTASTEPRPKNYRPSPFLIKNASISEGVFTLNDQSEKPLRNPQSFDHYHFTLHELNAELQDFKLIRDTVSFTTTLRGNERFSHTNIKQLHTKFLICDKQMRFDNLFLHLNNSVIRNQIVMSFDSQRDFKYWNSKVRMRANFDSTVVASEDLGRFVNDMYSFKDTYYLHGKFDGTVNQFKLTQLRLFFGRKSKLQGDFAFNGLPDLDKAKMDLQLNQAQIHVEDLRNYIGNDPVNAIKAFGMLRLDAHFEGTTQQFRTAGILHSDLGLLKTDFVMKLNPSGAKSTYKGWVETERFALGKLTQQAPLLGDVSLKGSIEGVGFSWKDAILNFNGDMKELHFNQYTYHNIHVNGELFLRQFVGRVAVKDSNLVFSLIAKVDFRDEEAQLDFLVNVQKANLASLYFTKQDWAFASYLDVKLSGSSLNNILGSVDLYNSQISYGTKKFFIADSSRFTSTLEDKQRTWQLTSSLGNVKLQGNFKPSQAFQDLQQLWQEYKLYFTGDEKTRKEYYAKKQQLVPVPYKLKYDVLLKDVFQLVRFMYPEAKFSRTQLSGELAMGNTAQFSLVSAIDTLWLSKDYQFYHSSIDLNTSKFYDRPEVLASLIAESEKHKLSILEPTERLSIEGAWDTDRIRFTSSIKQQKTKNAAKLNGDLWFIPEGIALQIEKSNINLLDHLWTLTDHNKVSITTDAITFENFALAGKENQMVSLNGKLSNDSNEELRFKAQNFNLETIAPIVGLSIVGKMNADVSLKDVYKHVYADSQLKIDGLSIDNFLIGDIAGNAIYDQESQIVNIDYNLERLQSKVLKIAGTYNPKASENKLNLNANLNQTSLQILEPFTKGLFSKLKGTASGDLKIKGDLQSPEINGAIDIKKGALFFDYLGTTLNFEDKIVFEPSEIRAKKFRLTDEEGNHAELNGGVFFSGKEIALQLGMKLNRFKMLNTTRQNNDVYYGTGYATGTLNITGYLSHINIDANLRSDRGTRLYIPLDQAQTAGNKDEIEFVTVTSAEKLAEEVALKASSSDSRLTMDFTFDFTPEAYGEVQFDKQTGDVMRANGAGQINLKIDTKGDFNMTGDYVLEKGDYTFTLQNVLNKKFDIQKGSKISWSGNPYEAMLDIKAAYTQNVNYLGSVIDTTQGGQSYRNRAEFTRRYPADVIINIKDRLLQPAISFDLTLHDYPQNPEFNSSVTAFQNRIRTDEQELNRQVSNLLLLGQIVPNNGNAFASVNLANNLMELVSNQLSNVFSKINPNLDVDLTLNGNGLNQDLINNLQLRFSYNFNDRFRVTRSGGFTTALNQTNALSLIGDWSLEWFVKKDGSVRLKTYNRNVQTSILGTLNTQYQTFTSGGMSILYSKSFNYLLPKKKKNIVPKEANEKQAETNKIDFLSN